MEFIIDRFENGYAVVEVNGETIDIIPTSILPENAKEGDIFQIKAMKEKTKERKIAIENKFKDLLK